MRVSLEAEGFEVDAWLEEFTRATVLLRDHRGPRMRAWRARREQRLQDLGQRKETQAVRILEFDVHPGEMEPPSE